MRAAVLHAAKDLRVEAVAGAALGPGEVEVRDRGRRHLRLRPALLFRRRLRHGAAEGADDPRPRDRRHASRASARRWRASQPASASPSTRAARAGAAATARRASSSTASTCASTAARCAFPMCRAAFASAGVRRRAGGAGAGRDVGRAGGLRRAVRGLPACGQPRRAPARQARAGHRRGPDRRADRDRGAARGRAEIVATDVADAPLAARERSAPTRRSTSAEKDALAALRRRQRLFRRDVRGLRQRAGARRRPCRRSPAMASWCRSASRAAR